MNKNISNKDIMFFKKIVESNSDVKSVFKKRYKTPEAFIEAIEQFIDKNIIKEKAFTIVLFYMKFHPELEKDKVKWRLYLNAYKLIQIDNKWGKFFKTQYKTPLDCIENIPDIATQSIVTIIQYYLIFQSYTQNQIRIWTNTASAVVLRDSNSKWRKYFATQYETPFDCIENIPDIATQSISTIIGYYLIFYPSLKKQERQWIRTANAVILRNSDSKWEKFFKTQYKTPLDCIENMPDIATQSIVTIIQYYLIFQSYTQNQIRRWITTACAVVLRDNNSKWRKFFTSQYKTPLDCIENIPDITTQSIATIVEYYFVFYPRLQYQKRICKIRS